MKKLLSLLAALALSASGLLAQNTLTVNVSDGSGPLEGVRVFFYNSPAAFGNSFQTLSQNFSSLAYTNAQGDATYFISGNIGQNDTIYWATNDCNGTMQWGAGTPASLAFSSFNVNLPVSCPPSRCDALVRTDTMAGLLIVQAFAMRDSAVGGVPGNRVLHSYIVDGQFYFKPSRGNSNYDSLMLPLSTFNTSAISVCYSRVDSVCPFICDSVVVGQSSGGGGNPNPITCNASFFPDSINSVLFQGQIVLGENSTTSRGTIIDYFWDFGDGTSINAQYPTHTYNSPTGVYNVCLTITAVDGVDTCVSTYCDSIGFDANGNPVFKGGSGFTINVVDPATFSAEEFTAADFSLYPNPAKDYATLSWEAGTKVKKIEVLTLNGQLVRSIQADAQEIRINKLAPGAYIIRVQTPQNSVPLKLLVD